MNPLNEAIMNATQAKKLADKSTYLFNDVMHALTESAFRNECVLIYAVRRKAVSEVALNNVIIRLIELGYKVDKNYSTDEIRIEW